MLCQRDKQFKFQRLERDFLFSAQHAVLVQTHGQPADLYRVCGQFCPFHDLFHAHKQFEHLKGLDEIVLRAVLQAGDFGVKIVPCRQKDHRDSVWLDVLKKRKSVFFRHHDIEDCQIVAVISRQRTRRRFAVRKEDSLHACRPQIHGDQAGNRGIVLRNQDSFLHSISFRHRRLCAVLLLVPQRGVDDRAVNRVDGRDCAGVA